MFGMKRQNEREDTTGKDKRGDARLESFTRSTHAPMIDGRFEPGLRSGRRRWFLFSSIIKRRESRNGVGTGCLSSNGITQTESTSQICCHFPRRAPGRANVSAAIFTLGSTGFAFFWVETINSSGHPFGLRGMRGSKTPFQIHDV